MSEDTKMDMMEEGGGMPPEIVKMYKKKISRHHTDVYLDSGFDSFPMDYVDLLHSLHHAKAEDTFLFHLANTGGDVYTAFQLCHAVKNTQATVTMFVTQPCYSAGAILALCGDNILFNPATFLMFHNYSTVDGGKGGEFLVKVKESDEHLHRSFEYFCSPFLTDAEFNTLYNDQDVYVRSYDKSLKARIKRHFGSK